MDTAEDDDDEFWQVALCHSSDYGVSTRAGSDSDSENHQDPSVASTASAVTYSIPWKTTNNEENSMVPLKLSPLADHGGVWSPLGAQAWHASSLLVAYLLRATVLRDGSSKNDRHRSLLSRFLDSWFIEADEIIDNEKGRFTALELGSGAVGLVGIVLGLILGDYFSGKSGPQGDTATTSMMRPHVILTDNEPSVLQNLQQNVTKTREVLEKEMALALLDVKPLDWGKDLTDFEATLGTSRETLQLVIGSELVYTHETAKACAHVVLSILKHYPNVLVFILQVTDRDGWNTVFAPILHDKQDIEVISDNEAIHDSDLHELAITLIPAGGTLDRFAYGGVYVFRKNAVVASLVRDGADS